MKKASDITILEIGNKIKLLRKSKKMTQLQLAKLLGCGQTTIAEWERNLGRIPSKKHLKQLADIFDVSFDFLLGKSSRNNPKLPCIGTICNGKVEKTENLTYHIEVPQSEYSKERFSYKIVDDFLEPIVSKGDYGIFQVKMPKDGNITIIDIEDQPYPVTRKWRQDKDTVMLLEVNNNQGCKPYSFKILEQKEKYFLVDSNRSQKKVSIKGVLVAVKKELKSIKTNDGINYIFS